MFKGKLCDAEFEHITMHPSITHSHSFGHWITMLVGWITKHNQNSTVSVANSSETITTASDDAMASCCHLHRQKNCS
jgi:hypothetical protein